MSEEVRTSGWVTTTVGEIATLIRGITYNKEQAAKSPLPDFKPVLRANNINGTLNFDDLVFVPQSLIGSEQFIKAGDIIFAMSSGSKHLVGKSARAISDFEGSYGAFCGLLRAHEHMNRDFLYYVFQNNRFRRLISEVAKGSNINNLKREHILDFEIALPPLPEQHRIVAKIEELFSELDKGIENLKTAREQLKVYRQALLKHAFEGKLTTQWRAANPDKLEPAAALLARIQTEREQRYRQQLQQWEQSKSPSVPLLQRGKTSSAASVPPFAKGGLGGISKPKAPKPLPPLTAEELAELPELPEGWGWVRVAEIGDVETGTTPPKDNPKNYGNEYPFFKPTDLEAGSNVRVAREYLSELGLSHSRFLPANSTLVTCIGATIGKTGITRIDGASNQQINSIIPFDGLLPDFTYYQATGPIFQDAVKSNASSTTLPILNKSKFEMLAMAVCSFSEQQMVVLEVESKLSEIDQLDQTLAASLQQAEALRQSILKKAFAGTLVAQDANDEPASALLARIRAEKDAQSAKPHKTGKGKA